ncbi:MAG: GAF and ANTAR domain-containing protein [Aeromicrobium sp.]
MTTTESTLTRFVSTLSAVRALGTLRERLCEASRLMLEADGVMITSGTVPDGPTTVGWTQLLSRRLELLQTAAGEGPLLDALIGRRVVLGDFGQTDDRRWPTLRRQLAELDFTGTLIAVPLRSELELSGALLAHRGQHSRDTDAEIARFLGNAIGTAVLQEPSIGAQSHVMAEVLTDREVVHQAIGVLQLETRIHYEDGLALLRALAFSRGEHLGGVAKAVVSGDLRLGHE